ncbi:hypothetical protein ACVOMV_16565 [Mesorhizobium atlanticum]
MSSFTAGGLPPTSPDLSAAASIVRGLDPAEELAEAAGRNCFTRQPKNGDNEDQGRH